MMLNSLIGETFFALKVYLVPGMDHRRTVIEFLRTQLSLPVQDEDVDAVHVINTIAGTTNTSAGPEHDNMQMEGASASVPANSS